MILIKDRHATIVAIDNNNFLGKYDTYKGSTHLILSAISFINCGKYDTYKGSTRFEFVHEPLLMLGKYDTYKGSTQDTWCIV